MADRISKEKRSANMARIRSKNTLIEIRFRKGLYKLGIRYSLNYMIFGKPDLVILSKRVAVFVNGCFWHQHEKCKLGYLPKSNVVFWETKLSKNRERDKMVRMQLKREGWKVITIWECEIVENLEKTLKNTARTINSLNT